MVMLSAYGEHPECPTLWCEEVGFHLLHRCYLTSMILDTKEVSALGLNVVGTSRTARSLELTVASSHDARVIPLTLGEAHRLGCSLVDAVRRYN